MTKTSAVYEAEHEVEFMLENGGTVDFYGSTLVLPPEARFGNLEGVRRYVDAACGHVGFTRVPRVRARKNDAKAHYEHSTHTIAVPLHQGSRSSWALRECVILHELAHAMTAGHEHDDVFCSQLVQLFTKCIAPEAGLLLARAYDERGITVTT